MYVKKTNALLFFDVFKMIVDVAFDVEIGVAKKLVETECEH